MSKINIGIVNENENIEYSGYIEDITNSSGPNTIINYYLSNKSKVFSGKLELPRFESNFAAVVKKLNSIVNTLDESK